MRLKAGENLNSVINIVSTTIFLARVLAISSAITAFAVALFVISSSALNFATLALT